MQECFAKEKHDKMLECVVNTAPDFKRFLLSFVLLAFITLIREV